MPNPEYQGTQKWSQWPGDQLALVRRRMKELAENRLAQHQAVEKAEQEAQWVQHPEKLLPTEYKATPQFKSPKATKILSMPKELVTWLGRWQPGTGTVSILRNTPGTPFRQIALHELAHANLPSYLSESASAKGIKALPKTNWGSWSYLFDDPETARRLGTTAQFLANLEKFSPGSLERMQGELSLYPSDFFTEVYARVPEAQYGGLPEGMARFYRWLKSVPPRTKWIP